MSMVSQLDSSRRLRPIAMRDEVRVRRGGSWYGWSTVEKECLPSDVMDLDSLVQESL
jgi:hypothetical protein